MKLRELATMSNPQRLKSLAETAESPDSLAQEIRDYEARYEMSTSALREGLKNGSIEETSAFCKWLVLADLVDDLNR